MREELRTAMNLFRLKTDAPIDDQCDLHKAVSDAIEAGMCESTTANILRDAFYAAKMAAAREIRNQTRAYRAYRSIKATRMPR